MTRARASGGCTWRALPRLAHALRTAERALRSTRLSNLLRPVGAPRPRGLNLSESRPTITDYGE